MINLIYLSEDPFTQDGDCWAINNWPDLSTISQKQWKRHFCVRSLCACWSLSHLSFGVDKFGVHWKIAERSLGDRWDHWALLECSLRIHWAFIERSLSIHWTFIEYSLKDCFPWRSLRNCFGLSQNFEETMATVEVTRQSLTDYWEILAIAGRSLKDCWEIWPFFHRSMISQWLSPLCKGGLRKWEKRKPIDLCNFNTHH